MGGFSTITGNGLGSVLNADNVSFDGTSQGGVVTTNGQLLIGSTATPHIRVGSLTAGTGTTITNGAGTITISASATVPTTFNTDSGTATPDLNVLKVFGGTGIDTSGLGNTVTIALDTSSVGQTITGDSGGALSPTAGNWNIVGGAALSAGTNAAITSGSGSTLTVTAINTAKWIVDPTANRGTHQTIAGALTAASSGETIFIRPGTYTENLTLKVGVNLCSFDCDALTPNVTIIGKMSLSTAGTVTISGIRLQTNSDNILAITGSAATNVNLVDCYINATNATAITNASSGGSKIYLRNCRGNLGTTGIAYFALTQTNSIAFDYCHLLNDGISLTSSTAANSCSIETFFTTILNQITTSNSAVCNLIYTVVEAGGSIAQTALTANGTGGGSALYCRFVSNTASAISVGVGASYILENCVIDSLNTNAIVGAGTVSIAGLSFLGTSNITTTTQTIISEGPSRKIGSTNTGNTNTFTVTNPSDTASSAALINVSVGGTSSADAFQTFTVAGTTNWSQGVDNSASDAFVIAASTALGTTNVMSVATTGEVNFPLQSAFLAFQPSNATNATGNGTVYTLGTTVDLTEVFDQNSDFDPTTGIFTAPVTGRYTLTAASDVSGAAVTEVNFTIQLITSNRTYDVTQYVTGGPDFYALLITALADMDANDTCTATIKGTGNGADTMTPIGSATLFTYFCGNLTC